MEYIITPIWGLLDYLTLTFFANSFFTLRHNAKISICFFVLIWCLASICAAVLPDGYLYRILMLVLFFTLLILLYRGTLFRYLLCGTICYTFLGIIDTLFIYGLCALLNISYDIIVWKKILYTATVTMGKMVEVLLSYLFMKYHRQKKIGTIQHRWLILTVIFPVSSLFMFLIVFMSFQDAQDLSISAFI